MTLARAWPAVAVAAASAAALGGAGWAAGKNAASQRAAATPAPLSAAAFVSLGAEPTFRIVGEEEIVFDWSRDACEPIDIPDVPARAFRDARGRVQLIASHEVSRRAIGPSLDAVRHECEPVMRSHENPDPSAFDDREWIGATYTPDGRTIYAIVDMEYQGNTHAGQCPSGNYFDCWWNTLNLAVSRDGGRTYRHARPPKQLIAASIRRYRPDGGVLGMFAASNIVRHSDGFYYVLFFQAMGDDLAQLGFAGNCVMRTRSIGKPTSWRAWDGTAFTVRFADPYRQRTTLANVCTPFPRDVFWSWYLNITYNTYLGRYVALGLDDSEGWSPPQTGNAKGWLTLSTSRDLVHWTKSRRVLAVESVRAWANGDAPATAYTVVLDPRSRSRNFLTVGRRAYLYYTRFNNFAYDRDLVRVPIEFSRG